ncbi:uncharacterized protein LOC124272647 [Haliotis rubra]|uniref:uncharacterized protein LOC124272647 n=1 Tax=Haliotis rubra TaxID=36100 RepID=UPI001EE544B6|nr:uncharacterized protein LOC124272647 [Haliotis rubra]
MFGIRRQKFENLISAIGVCSFKGDKDDHPADGIEKLISGLTQCNDLSNTVSKKLMEIAADVDDLEQNKRLTKVICAGTGLIGAALSISGLLLGPVGMPLALVGAAVGVGGCR